MQTVRLPAPWTLGGAGWGHQVPVKTWDWKALPRPPLVAPQFSIPACSLLHRSLTPLRSPLPFPKTSSFQLSCSGNRPAFSMPSLSPQGSQGCWVWAGMAAPRPPWGPADTGYHDHSTPQFPGASGATGKLSRIQVATSRKRSRSHHWGGWCAYVAPREYEKGTVDGLPKSPIARKGESQYVDPSQVLESGS